MRPDQVQRLRELSEKLADVVLDECDPDTWPGAKKPLAEVSQQERGDRYWCKKNAAATFALLQRAESLLPDGQGSNRGPAKEPPELESEIAQAEKAAAQALEKARSRASNIVKRSKAGG